MLELLEWKFCALKVAGRKPWARVDRTALHRSRRTRRVFRKSSSRGIIFALSLTARYALANPILVSVVTVPLRIQVVQYFMLLISVSQFDYELREYGIVVDFAT